MKDLNGDGAEQSLIRSRTGATSFSIRNDTSKPCLYKVSRRRAVYLSDQHFVFAPPATSHTGSLIDGLTRLSGALSLKYVRRFEPPVGTSHRSSNQPRPSPPTYSITWRKDNISGSSSSNQRDVFNSVNLYKRNNSQTYTPLIHLLIVPFLQYSQCGT